VVMAIILIIVADGFFAVLTNILGICAGFKTGR
jgi:hypothetical protein